MRYIILTILLISITILGAKKTGDPIVVTNDENSKYGEEIVTEQEGTYSNIYANYNERYILYDLNYFRMKPSVLENEDENPDYAHCEDWGDCYDPQKPLFYNIDLSRAARFHSDDMIQNTCFQHEDCDGGSFVDRVSGFYNPYSTIGENIAAGHGYINVTKNLINEIGAAPGTDGHRNNIFSENFDEVGVGYLEGGEYRNYVTQNFGRYSGTEVFQVIPTAIHTPYEITDGETLTLKALYHDSVAEGENRTAQLPQGGYVVVNGECLPLTRTIYTMNDSWYTGEYKAELTKESGCVNYSFQFVDHNGELKKYPDIGQLGAGDGCDLYVEDVITIDCRDIENNPCYPNPCNDENKTVCIDTDGIAVCSCNSGYHEGENGECILDTVCDPNPCTDQNKTRCEDNNGVAVCNCDYGYHEEGDSCVEDATDVCDPNPCSEEHKTICTAINGAAVCSCDENYEENSETGVCEINLCLDVVCGQYQECNRDTGSCQCQDGYSLQNGSCVYSGSGGAVSGKDEFAFCSYSNSKINISILILPAVFILFIFYLRRRENIIH